MKQYSLICFDPNIEESDDVAMLYPVKNGKWCKVEDHEAEIEDYIEKLQFLIESLQNLRNCNIKTTTPEQLNEYIDKVLQGYV